MSKDERTKDTYGWCKSCGALVFGSSKCHKCGGEVKPFCVDMELFNLKEQIKELEAENKQIREIKCPPISDGDTCICPIEELEAKLKEFGNHKSNCAYIQGLRGNTIEKCNCGFEQALEG